MPSPERTRRAGLAKAVAIGPACRPTGWTHRAVGEYYGGISGAAVSVVRRNIREGPAVQARSVDRLLAKLMEEIGGGRQS